MEALLISIINLTIVSIFLILFKKKSCLLKTIAFISISFSVTVLCLFYLFNNSFGASTPVNIKSKNETNQTVEIYSIVFWDEPFVFYDKKLNPNEKSTDFCKPLNSLQPLTCRRDLIAILQSRMKCSYQF